MRRYSSRQSVSFGRGVEGAGRAQGIVIIVLVAVIAALLIVYFAAVRPGLTARSALQQQYRQAMNKELRSAIKVADELSRNSGESGNSTHRLRSFAYAVDTFYDLYKQAGGTRIAEFEASNILAMIDDQLIPSQQSSGQMNGVIVTDIQNALDRMLDAINAYGDAP